jgi:hypothetical protein
MFSNVRTNLCLQLTVIWKVVEKLLMPKSSKTSAGESKPPAEGMKWSVAPGTNLWSNFTAKIFRESKQTLDEFAKELRSFSIVDMSGMMAMCTYFRTYIT